jgi:hypothetical protein
MREDIVDDEDCGIMPCAAAVLVVLLLRAAVQVMQPVGLMLPYWDGSGIKLVQPTGGLLSAGKQLHGIKHVVARCEQLVLLPAEAHANNQFQEL